jgi:hypothetical protein
MARATVAGSGGGDAAREAATRKVCRPKGAEKRRLKSASFIKRPEVRRDSRDRGKTVSEKLLGIARCWQKALR